MEERVPSLKKVGDGVSPRPRSTTPCVVTFICRKNAEQTAAWLTICFYFIPPRNCSVIRDYLVFKLRRWVSHKPSIGCCYRGTFSPAKHQRSLVSIELYRLVKEVHAGEQLAQHLRDSWTAWSQT